MLEGIFPKLQQVPTVVDRGVSEAREEQNKWISRLSKGAPKHVLKSQTIQYWRLYSKTGTETAVHGLANQASPKLLLKLLVPESKISCQCCAHRKKNKVEWISFGGRWIKVTKH